jgi:hypothetical protein
MENPLYRVEKSYFSWSKFGKTLLVKETLGREACGWLLKLHLSLPLWLATEYEDNEKVNFSSILLGALEGASSL